MNQDELYMTRCLELARKGLGSVSPNPMVGCVLVFDNNIIAEGYHEVYGGPHAEVNAISRIHDQNLLKKCKLYVNLEPCAHHGKTPPCANLIVEKQIPEVIIGCQDSYSKVSGKGIEKLQNAGIEVKVGVLEKESRSLNRRFFTYHEKNRPYIILKWAQSKDGFMDIDRSGGEKGTFWISSQETKRLVHKWRSEEDGILVGKNTIANDNPQLTVRESEGKSPVRIVIDEHLRLDYPAYHVGDHSTRTIILTRKKIKSAKNLEFTQPVSFEIRDILKKLHELEIQSILVEGGQKTLTSFIASEMWDEARIITGETNLLRGLAAPQLEGELMESYDSGPDQIKIIRHA